MRQLEICATIKHLRPVPYYLSIDCEQRIMGFIHGDCPPEQEFREFNSFRKAVMALVSEALRLPEGCERIELPHVSVEMKIGEDFLKPSALIYFSLGQRSWDHDVWTLCWGTGDDAIQIIFFDLMQALLSMKKRLDDETSEWASEVMFSSEGR